MNQFSKAFSVTLFATAFLFGGCLDAEPGEEADESAVEAEPTAEDSAPLTPPEASAAYNGACGSGYNVINSHSLPGGTVYLTYNNNTGKNCVVTVRNSPGSPILMCAGVMRTGGTWNPECGNFTSHAGPRYVYAPNACIDWGGKIKGSDFYAHRVHCG